MIVCISYFIDVPIVVAGVWATRLKIIFKGNLVCVRMRRARRSACGKLLRCFIN